MTQIILSLLVGLLLLSLMLYWLLRGETASNDAPAAWDALDCLRASLLPACLIDRILDYSDFTFVREQMDQRILRLFETERKAIALDWLRYTRLEVKSVMTFHVKSARHDARLLVMLEIRLALEYVGFLLACAALGMLIRMRDPFRALNFVRYTVTAAARFCAASENILVITSGCQSQMLKASKNR